MYVHKKRPFDPVGGTETPEKVVLHRRNWLKTIGCLAGAGTLAAGGYYAWRRFQGSDEQVVSTVPLESGEPILGRVFPARRDARFTYGREETARSAAARYTNFYEFTQSKYSWRYVDQFEPYPWSITIGGLCSRPLTIEIDDLDTRYADAFTERQYRHRCVERWAMAIPWTGIPLRRVLEDVAPTAAATHVQFTSFMRPNEAPHQSESSDLPWPYTEGLTISEAMNDLAFLAVGMYGKPLLKQHGAPIRLVVPWKYGFKSIKSITRIEFVNVQPPTFWSTLNADAYPFQANVEPDVPRPWPQHEERMLGSNEIFPTQLYNGYAEYVADLYA